jgi:hypothetical protein
MADDRELLELAAKAAGIVPYGVNPWQWIRAHWNPLTDDGDAFRLAVKLRLDICFWDGFKQVSCRRNEHSDAHHLHGQVGYGAGADREPTPDNVRRAIVRAAAEIAKGAMTHDEFVLMFPGRFEQEEVERAAAEIGRSILSAVT